MKKYIIRDEGIKPLLSVYGEYCSLEKIKSAHENFKTSFRELIKDYLPKDVDIVFESLDSQLNRAKRDLRDKNTISLDSMYRGTYNIRASRVFDIFGKQKNFEYISSSIPSVSIKEQVEVIPDGIYTIVEDDSIAKGTVMNIVNSLKDGELFTEKLKKNKYYKTNSLMQILGNLHSGIVIDDIYLLSNTDDSVFDTVDLRDFIFGASDSGLMVSSDFCYASRVPYCYPFVSLDARASIDSSKQVDFSKKLCILNKKLVKSLVPDLKLVETDKNFQLFAENILEAHLMTSMTKICDMLKFYIDNFQ